LGLDSNFGPGIDFTHHEIRAMTRFTHTMTTKITAPMIREVRGMFAPLMGRDHHHSR